MTWGVFGLYFKLLVHIPAVDLLAHRQFWSLVFFVVILGVSGRLGELAAVFRDPKLVLRVAAAAVVIATNSLVFIIAIQTGHALDSSLGYYIFPLVAVLIGTVVLRERLSAAQWVAVALGAAAVLVLSLGLGVTPWAALVIAVTFGAYGYIKKTIPLDPVVSVAAEGALISPFALLWLALPHAVLPGQEGTFGADLRTSLLLMLSGVLTAVPLALFSYGSRGLPLSTVGIVQYVNPTMQFFVAVLVFGEPFTRWHAIAFPLIWTGLALYSASAWMRERAARR